MQRNLLPQIAIGLLVIVAIIFGLAVTGGPGGGRMEKRDKARLKDLRELVTFVHCVSNKENGKLPETLKPYDNCDRKIQLNDPYTDKPYAYVRLSDTKFRICADFEWPEILRDSYVITGRFDYSDGCVNDTYKNK